MAGSESLADQIARIKAITKVNPQVDNGYIQICHEVYEHLIQINYKSTYTLPVILAAVRKTWGWQKKVDAISISQIEGLTTYERWSIIRALKEAEALHILLVERKSGFPSQIAINKHYDTWLTSSVGATRSIGATRSVGATSTSSVGATTPTSDTSSVGATHKRNYKETTKETRGKPVDLIPLQERDMDGFTFWDVKIGYSKNRVNVLAQAFKHWHKPKHPDDLADGHGRIGVILKLPRVTYMDVLDTLWKTKDAVIEGSRLDYIHGVLVNITKGV